MAVREVPFFHQGVEQFGRGLPQRKVVPGPLRQVAEEDQGPGSGLRQVEGRHRLVVGIHQVQSPGIDIPDPDEKVRMKLFDRPHEFSVFPLVSIRACWVEDPDGRT